MPRTPRSDQPDGWHHVMNRGIARRTLFENELDMRTFLSRLALRIRAGQLELHAFCILTTHFHMLLRSPRGELSAAMCEVQREYSRWFNRTRRRDGPLFRGRFVSKPVEDLDYREQLVRYIDFNPVGAGLVATPALYPYGSARAFAAEKGPIWLCRSWIEQTVIRRTRAKRYSPMAYPSVFGERLSTRLEALVEERLRLREPGDDPLAKLIDASRGQVLDWMRYKAELADGMPVGTPVCDPASALEAVESLRCESGSWYVKEGRKSCDGWIQVSAGILRDLCGLSWDEIGAQLSSSRNGAWRRARRHRHLVASQPEYAERAAAAIQAAIRICHGGTEGDPNRGE